MTLDDARRLALALPEAHEVPHFDRTSFRIGTKIFATAEAAEGTHLNVFVDPHETRALVTAQPATYAELWWGKTLSGVRVTLPTAEETELAELLADAWRRKAPKRLHHLLDEPN